MRFKLLVDVDVQAVAHLGLIVRGVVRRVTLHYLGRMALQLRDVLTTSVSIQHFSRLLGHRLDVLPFTVEDTSVRNSQNK